MMSTIVEQLKSEYCTLGEAAQLMAVNPATIWRWIRLGKIDAERVGREVLLPRLAIQKAQEAKHAKAKR